MALNPKCEQVETAKGVALTVTGVAQVRWSDLPRRRCIPMVHAKHNQITVMALKNNKSCELAIHSIDSCALLWCVSVLQELYFKWELPSDNKCG